MRFLPFNEFLDVIFTDFSVDIIDGLRFSLEFIVSSYGTARIGFNLFFFFWLFYWNQYFVKVMQVWVVSRYLHASGNFFNWFAFFVFLNLFQEAFSIFWNGTINFGQSFDSTKIGKNQDVNNVHDSIEHNRTYRSRRASVTFLPSITSLKTLILAMAACLPACCKTGSFSFSL